MEAKVIINRFDEKSLLTEFSKFMLILFNFRVHKKKFTFQSKIRDHSPKLLPNISNNSKLKMKRSEIPGVSTVLLYSQSFVAWTFLTLQFDYVFEY